MPASAKSALHRSLPVTRAKAKVTSKGQITVPAVIRELLGVKPGDSLVFESQENGFRVVRDTEANVFEQFRGVGVPGIGPGRDGVLAYMHELRGYDEYDDSIA